MALAAGLVLLGSHAVSCVGPGTSAQVKVGPEGKTYVPSLPVSHPPFDEFHPSWLQRLDQPYVYVDHVGSYVDTRSHIPMLLREVVAQGLETDGSPFCLFYDDPALTPAHALRSRACIPIRGHRSPVSPLEYEVLPSRTIALAYVSGPYADVSRAYPHMFAYMDSMDWVASGPVRETYIVQPNFAAAPSDLLCEIQIPVQSTRQ